VCAVAGGIAAACRIDVPVGGVLREEDTLLSAGVAVFVYHSIPASAEVPPATTLNARQTEMPRRLAPVIAAFPRSSSQGHTPCRKSTLADEGSATGFAGVDGASADRE
jgi:hypothetical protein